MEVRIAIQVNDDKDHKHLSTTLRLANQRCGVRLVEAPLADADVVIVRRGEAGSGTLLRAADNSGLPILVIYSSNPGEKHPWTLRWPARTTDLIPLAESLFFQVQARAGMPGQAATASSL